MFTSKRAQSEINDLKVLTRRMLQNVELKFPEVLVHFGRA